MGLVAIAKLKKAKGHHSEKLWKDFLKTLEYQAFSPERYGNKQCIYHLRLR